MSDLVFDVTANDNASGAFLRVAEAADEAARAVARLQAAIDNLGAARNANDDAT